MFITALIVLFVTKKQSSPVTKKLSWKFHVKIFNRSQDIAFSLLVARDPNIYNENGRGIDRYRYFFNQIGGDSSPTFLEIQSISTPSLLDNWLGRVIGDIKIYSDAWFRRGGQIYTTKYNILCIFSAQSARVQAERQKTALKYNLI